MKEGRSSKIQYCTLQHNSHLTILTNYVVLLLFLSFFPKQPHIRKLKGDKCIPAPHPPWPPSWVWMQAELGLNKAHCLKPMKGPLNHAGAIKARLDGYCWSMWLSRTAEKNVLTRIQIWTHRGFVYQHTCIDQGI